MYRGRLWTMRQFAGFGTVEETNERFRYLLEAGQHGLSTAFDMPTLMGLDSDHARSLGEVGVEGVAVDTVDDMETLFDGIPLDEVTRLDDDQRPGRDPARLLRRRRRGERDRRRPARRHDPDRHPQGVHRPEGVVLPDRAGDAAGHRHGRVLLHRDAALAPDLDLRATTSARPARPPQQELAFTLKDGFTYVERAIERGLDVDAFAPRLSFFFNAHLDFFEEIAKYRAARRIWAREMRDTYGARDPRSQMMRFHTQTAGVSLTAQQPLVNIVRTTIEALAGVLGGTQSLHTNSYDEALALPTAEAVRVALRTQQVIAHESGVTNTADPLGGSYFVERLTDEMEAAAYEYFDRIDELGGMVEAIKTRLPPARDRRRRLPLPARGRLEAADRRRGQRATGSRTSRSSRSTAPTRRPSGARRARLDRDQAGRDQGQVDAALAALRRAADAGREPDAER